MFCYVGQIFLVFEVGLPLAALDLPPMAPPSTALLGPPCMLLRCLALVCLGAPGRVLGHPGSVKCTPGRYNVGNTVAGAMGGTVLDGGVMGSAAASCEACRLATSPPRRLAS